MNGPTRDQVYAVVFGIAGPRNVDASEVITDLVMDLLAETQPKVLWEGATKATRYHRLNDDQSALPVRIMPVPRGTRVAVMATGAALTEGVTP